MKPPSYYEDVYTAAVAAGDITKAIAAMNSAAAASIGHKRTARYERTADYLADKHNVKRHHDYLVRND